jgi:predicted ArsR family transcriptional regulator
MRDVSIKASVLTEIETNGPATHHDIADALGMVPKTASAHLCNLGKTGVLMVSAKVRVATIGRPCNLWKLAAPANNEGETNG